MAQGSAQGKVKANIIGPTISDGVRTFVLISSPTTESLLKAILEELQELHQLIEEKNG